MSGAGRRFTRTAGENARVSSATRESDRRNRGSGAAGAGAAAAADRPATGDVGQLVEVELAGVDLRGVRDVDLVVAGLDADLPQADLTVQVLLLAGLGAGGLLGNVADDRDAGVRGDVEADLGEGCARVAVEPGGELLARPATDERLGVGVDESALLTLRQWHDGLL